MHKILYAMPTSLCNLSCPHCEIRTQHESYNEDRFLYEFHQWEGDVIIFGGEPTLFRDRLSNIISDPKIISITTNLLNLDDELIQYYNRIHVSTSWNKSRFTNCEFNLWLSNLEKLKQHSIDVQLLITMTPDLIYDTPLDEFMELLHILEEKTSISVIHFEQLIDDNMTREFYMDVDEWLCTLYDQWVNKINISCTTFDTIHLGLQNNCTGIFYTLTPDGSIRHGCAHIGEKIKVCEDCIGCEYAHICTPCRFHKYCSFTKKLYHKIVLNDVKDLRSI